MEQRTLAQMLGDPDFGKMNTKDLRRRSLTAGIANAVHELRLQVEEMTQFINGELYNGPESIPEENLVVIRRELMKAVNKIEQTNHDLTIYSEKEVTRYDEDGGR